MFLFVPEAVGFRLIIIYLWIFFIFCQIRNIENSEAAKSVPQRHKFSLINRHRQTPAGHKYKATSAGGLLAVPLFKTPAGSWWFNL